MSEQKTEQQQIEEMAYSLCDANKHITDSCNNCPLTKDNERCLKKEYSKKLYAADYRKQSDTASKFAKKLKEKFKGYEATCYDGQFEGWHDLSKEIDELAAEFGAEVKE